MQVETTLPPVLGSMKVPVLAAPAPPAPCALPVLDEDSPDVVSSPVPPTAPAPAEQPNTKEPKRMAYEPWITDLRMGYLAGTLQRIGVRSHDYMVLTVGYRSSRR